MLQRRDDQIPLEALRDLIGLVRAMYRARKADGAPPRELEKCARVGRDLREAYNMGLSSTPGTMGYWAAWQRAESAANAAVNLVDCLESAEPIVKAAQVAVRRGGNCSGSGWKNTAIPHKRRQLGRSGSG